MLGNINIFGLDVFLIVSLVAFVILGRSEYFKKHKVANTSKANILKQRPLFNINLLITLFYMEYIGSFILFHLGVEQWLSIVVGLPLIIVVIITCLILFSKRARSSIITNITALLVRFVREWQSRDFAAAQKYSKRKGRVYYKDNCTFWTNCDTDIENIVPQLIDQGKKDLHAITGCVINTIKPLRVICFSKDTELLNYSQIIYDDISCTGYYGGIINKKICLANDLATMNWQGLKGILLHELSHHILRSVFKRDLPPWINEGLATTIQNLKYPIPTYKEAIGRIVKALDNRYLWLKGDVLVNITYSNISKWLSNEEAREQNKAWAFYFQCRLVIDMLYKNYGNTLYVYFSEINKSSRAITIFNKIFGFSVSDAIEECKKYWLSADLNVWQAADNISHGHIQAIAAVMCDKRALPKYRIVAISTLGCCGYLEAGEYLVKALGDIEMKAFHEYIVNSLQWLSGITNIKDFQQWQKWYKNTCQTPTNNMNCRKSNG